MYKKHFGLERRIYRGNTAGADVFVGPQTASIVTGIKKALAAPDAVVTLTGPVGCGKSTAVAHSLGAISGKNAIVRVGRFPLQRGELLDLLFDHMRIQQRPQRGNQKLALFRQLLFNLAENDSRMFLLVEDAPFLGPDMLAELEVVTAADTGPSDGAAVVLMGDEYLKELLASKSLARLRQRVRLRKTLEPCGIEELNGYLRHSFRQAGGEFDRIFANGATELLHELSGGILRVVNNLVESSLEAAADAKAATVELELVRRIADEEFGLTGTFTRLPEISSKQPEPTHSDDETAELVAVSLPEPEPVAKAPAEKPAAKAIPETPAVERAPKQDDDDIPELIQDTQPALAILNDAPSPPKPAAERRKEDTLPDIEALTAELGAEPPIPEAAAPTSPKPAAKETTSTEPKPKPAAVVKPKPESAAVDKPKPEPAAARQPKPIAKPEPAPQSASVGKEPETPKAPAPEAKFELELEKEPEPTADTAIPTLSDETPDVDETPAWDRDPTLAELRPDLDALERAMAVAQGRDPSAADEPAPPAHEPAAKEQPKDDIEEIPEITLDDSINRKVDRAALEKKQRLEKEGLLVEDECADEQAAGEEAARDEKAEAELEKIAAGLAKAKSIEDVDDKMAETLFGEELSVAAAAVAARVAEEAAAAAAETSAAPQEPAAKAQPAAKSDLEKEFENVWGETPGIEVSIDSEIEDQKGGLDISASQRLATVRALSAGKPQAATQKTANAAPPPAPAPDPIEEQITTSLTQTMKALKVNPDPAAVNDDDDDDERKGGFFSRFRRS
jgi:type II secretory pathway predicted ATPase ExeA